MSQTCKIWRKNRIAARLFLLPEGRLQGRNRTLARRLLADPEVTDRLIHQGINYLHYLKRRHG